MVYTERFTTMHESGRALDVALRGALRLLIEAVMDCGTQADTHWTLGLVRWTQAEGNRPESHNINFCESVVDDVFTRCVQVRFDGLEGGPPADLHHNTRVHRFVDEEALREASAEVVAGYLLEIFVPSSPDRRGRVRSEPFDPTFQ
jgi:hypothetical protein